MNVNNVEISILLPVYNAAEFLRGTVLSILNQTFRNFELIIINDSSTDASAQIIKSFQDERIQFYENEQNLGLIKTLNRGISIARGRYLARCDADDLYDPRRLELQFNYLEKNKQVAVLGTNAWMIDTSDTIIDSPKFFPKSPLEVMVRLCRMSPLFHPSVMMRTEVIRSVGGYDDESVHGEDYHLWLKVLRKGHYFANLSERLIFYRVHSKSISKVFSDLQAATSASTLRTLFREDGHSFELDQIMIHQNPNVATLKVPASLRLSLLQASRVVLKRTFSEHDLKNVIALEECWYDFRVLLNCRLLEKPGVLAQLVKDLLRHPRVALRFLKELILICVRALYIKLLPSSFVNQIINTNEKVPQQIGAPELRGK